MAIIASSGLRWGQGGRGSPHRKPNAHWSIRTQHRRIGRRIFFSLARVSFSLSAEEMGKGTKSAGEEARLGPHPRTRTAANHQPAPCTTAPTYHARPPPNPSQAACSHTQRTLAHAANQLFSLSKKRDHTHPPVPQALHVAPHLWFERCSRNRFPPAHTHTHYARSAPLPARPPALRFSFFPFPKFFSSQPDHRTGSRDDGHCSSMGPWLCARPPRAFVAVIVVFLPPGGRGKKKSEEESVREGESIWR